MQRLLRLQGYPINEADLQHVTPLLWDTSPATAATTSICVNRSGKKGAGRCVFARSHWPEIDPRMEKMFEVPRRFVKKVDSVVNYTRTPNSPW